MAIDAEKILKSIVKNPDSVKFNRKWGFYINVDFEAVKMIGLIPQIDGTLAISLYFGESQSQSRAFYTHALKLDRLDSKWEITPNFHIAGSYENLFYFQTPNVTSVGKYVNFWREHAGLLYRHSPENIEKLLVFLSENRIISFDSKTRERFQEQVLYRDYTRLHICASLGVHYNIAPYELLHKDGSLVKLLTDKINQALSIIGENGNSFLKFESADPPDF